MSKLELGRTEELEDFSPMSRPQLGHAEDVEAFGHLAHRTLWLVAKGHNRSTGWANWFQPDRPENVFAFMQQPPEGISAPVVLPFTVMNPFPLPAENEVKIRELDASGKAVVVTIPITTELCPVEEAAFSALMPSHLVVQGFAPVRGGVSSVRHHLGAFDRPCGCATWTNPFRARRYDLYLEVDVAGAQDVVSAVSECFEQPAIATALALLLTPVGWAGGPTLFTQLMQACLAIKLKNVLRVQVQADNHCV